MLLGVGLEGGQKRALAEAYTAVTSILSASLGNQFFTIGGHSVVSLGSMRKTEDLDFAVLTEAPIAFEAATNRVSRFRNGAVANWYFICPEDKGHYCP